MIRLHPNLFFSIPREQFHQAVAQLDARIPGLTDNQVIAELHKIAALPSQRGRDGHSGMVSLDRRLDSFLPFEVYRFSDGLFILRARSPHQDLVGTEGRRSAREGGDNTTYGPLLDMLEQNAAINKPGKLFTIMDRGTFSAAGSFVTDMERRTETLLVGEPTGGAPNQYGDAR